MRFRYQASLVAFFLVFPYLVPATAKLDRCSWVAFGAEVQNFGTRGRGGGAGKAGNNGKNSDSLTLFLDGSPLKLDLSGQNGTDGERGTNGDDGRCTGQPENSTRDLQAAGGGDGGNGGNGGDGGNGGPLTLYAKDLALLQQVMVNASGGKGGQGGEGGRGGKGCRCQEPFWTIQTCSGRPGSPDYRCTTREFRCRDGIDGTSGNNGRPGRDGLLGQLTLIQLDRPLTADQPTASVPLSELKERGYILSKNSWETRTGAASLFAPGSTIDDQYRVLVDRTERSMILIWNAPQSFDRFADQRFTLSLNDNKEMKITLPPDLWIEGTTQQKNKVTEFVVYNAIFERDVTKLADRGITGNGKNLRVFLEDTADRSNLIGTKFFVRYRVSRWSGNDPQISPSTDFVTRYEGEIPPELVTQDGNRFTLAIGQLPLPAEASRSGTGVEIELTATRTFAGYSKDQKITLRDTIKGVSR
ncbi:collagen-like protein [Pannus brasiliensis CCIBt3594]|uniref:Collagen-like protein n=1 Tax=Pannus brasiliensis CCIBt3594 TaxID=1427578 RepID=A0AAW9QDD4_9CHRO